jgi:hypothetical protein
MRFLKSSVIACALAVALASSARAQAPATQPPAETVSEAPPPGEEPSLEERRLVAYVATGVAVASLITGITFGILAQAEFDCAKDVIRCNAGLQNKIVGEELFDVRSEIEQKALAADMAYLFAAASAVVATVGYLRGFVFVEEGETTAALPPAPGPAPGALRLAGVTP